jgi:GTP-binding protein HflX
MLDDDIARLKEALDEVRRTRRLQRAGRRKRETPVIALVGYTNAGKSTLFNALTGAGVFVRDMPFATLDPTIRALGLPSGREAALVDTVGFISDLPVHLIESFQATLEEVLDADLLVHVRDRSSPEDFAQRDDVVQVLEQLEKTSARSLPPMIEAWNKADRLEPDAAAALALAALGQDAVLVSALQGTGLERLREEIEHRLAAGAQLASVRLAPHQGEARAWLYAHAEVRGEVSDEGGSARLSVRARPDVIGRFQARFPSVVIGPDDVGDDSDEVSGQGG